MQQSRPTFAPGSRKHKRHMIRQPLQLLLATILLLCAHALHAQRRVCLVFTSDLHYGMTRDFRGRKATSAEVCRAMADAIRKLPGTMLPRDGGVGAGEPVDSLDFVVCGGDVANRMERGVQTAAESWRQFAAEWLAPGMPELLVLPGNHDISNATGFIRPLTPPRDATCAAAIYNHGVRPRTPRTAGTFDFATDKTHYIVEREGIRLIFAGLWLDTPARTWLDSTLSAAPRPLPSFLFTHMDPEAEAQRFINPYGDHSLDPAAGFENLLGDTCSVGRTERPVREIRAAERFIARHPEVKAWFHGHTHHNTFYRWTGVDSTVSLPAFRVDSPMKGYKSRTDEKLLSFQIVLFDPAARRMTVREYRWNAPGSPWGESATIVW